MGTERGRGPAETARSDRENLRADLRRLMMETGLRPTELARRAGLSPSTLTKFLAASGPGHVLSTRTLSRIARATGRRPSPEPLAPGGDIGAVLADPPRPGAVDVPVLGHARGGRDGLFFDNGIVESYVPRPHVLTSVRDAFAVRMSSDSQEPAFRHGDLLYVNPNLPPKPGDDVVIELADGAAYIKRLLRRTPETLAVRQFNPPRNLSFRAGDIARVHTVVAVVKART